MNGIQHLRMNHLASAAAAALLLSACGSDDVADDIVRLPQLAAASGGALSACAELAARIAFPNTTISTAVPIAAGT